jgi:site-specific recombinase XerC
MTGCRGEMCCPCRDGAVLCGCGDGPALKARDVLLDRQTAVHLHGKGRKQRVITLWKNTATELRDWLTTINPAPDAAVFPNRAGAPLTRLLSRVGLADDGVIGGAEDLDVEGTRLRAGPLSLR